jgi:hypothetical protein
MNYLAAVVDGNRKFLVKPEVAVRRGVVGCVGQFRRLEDRCPPAPATLAPGLVLLIASSAKPEITISPSSTSGPTAAECVVDAALVDAVEHDKGFVVVIAARIAERRRDELADVADSDGDVVPAGRGCGRNDDRFPWWLASWTSRSAL